MPCCAAPQALSGTATAGRPAAGTRRPAHARCPVGRHSAHHITGGRVIFHFIVRGRVRGIMRAGQGAQPHVTAPTDSRYLSAQLVSSVGWATAPVVKMGRKPSRRPRPAPTATAHVPNCVIPCPLLHRCPASPPYPQPPLCVRLAQDTPLPWLLPGGLHKAVPALPCRALPCCAVLSPPVLRPSLACMRLYDVTTVDSMPRSVAPPSSTRSSVTAAVQDAPAASRHFHASCARSRAPHPCPHPHRGAVRTAPAARGRGQKGALQGKGVEALRR